MPKVKNIAEPNQNRIEQANAIDRGRYLNDKSIDIIFCDPPLFKNNNDRLLNNWTSESDYKQWFRVFTNIASLKLRKTGIFFLIGELEEIHDLIGIIEEFGFQLTVTYYIFKNKKSAGKKTKECYRTNRVIDVVMVFTKDFQKKVKKLLKLKQEETKKSAREINIELGGNGNGGGYWSLYCGDNNKNIMPTEEHWKILKKVLNIDLEYNDIHTQFVPYEGNNLWEDITYPDDKFLTGSSRPTALYDRLLKMDRKVTGELVVWDPFCGYGNSTIACRKLNVNYYASEFDMTTYHKAMLNTGNSLNIIRPIEMQEL